MDKISKIKTAHHRFKVYGYTGGDCCGGFPAHDGYVTKGEAQKIRATLCLRGFRFEGGGGWRGWIEEFPPLPTTKAR